MFMEQPHAIRSAVERLTGTKNSQAELRTLQNYRTESRGRMIMNHGTRKALLLGAVGLGTYLTVRGAVRSGRWIDLHGRTVLITGGSRGLGLVIARQLAARGARLAICSREPDELQRASDDLTA